MADHGTHHQVDDTNNKGEVKSKTAFRSSFWLVVILVGMFIAALNFISVMGSSDEGHGNHEATSTGTLKEEGGLGKPAAEGQNTQTREGQLNTDDSVQAH